MKPTVPAATRKRVEKLIKQIEIVQEAIYQMAIIYGDEDEVLYEIQPKRMAQEFEEDLGEQSAAIQVLADHWRVVIGKEPTSSYWNYRDDPRTDLKSPYFDPELVARLGPRGTRW